MVDYIFRPHHLLCNYCFIGEGYNDKFIENFSKINEDLKQNPHKIIKLVNISDDICKECNHKKGKECSTEDKITSLDMKHQDMLGIKNGQELSWNEAVELIKTNITKDKFHYMCHTCEWYNYGICYNKIFKVGG
ncbi:MAG: DUF1284 domain-containing protein [Neisseriaceae bacterium]